MTHDTPEVGREIGLSHDTQFNVYKYIIILYYYYYGETRFLNTAGEC